MIRVRDDDRLTHDDPPAPESAQVSESHTAPGGNPPRESQPEAPGITYSKRGRIWPTTRRSASRLVPIPRCNQRSATLSILLMGEENVGFRRTERNRDARNNACPPTGSGATRRSCHWRGRARTGSDMDTHRRNRRG